MPDKRARKEEKKQGMQGELTCPDHKGAFSGPAPSGSYCPVFILQLVGKVRRIPIKNTFCRSFLVTIHNNNLLPFRLCCTAASFVFNDFCIGLFVHNVVNNCTVFDDFLCFCLYLLSFLNF